MNANTTRTAAVTALVTLIAALDNGADANVLTDARRAACRSLNALIAVLPNSGPRDRVAIYASSIALGYPLASSADGLSRTVADVATVPLADLPVPAFP